MAVTATPTYPYEGQSVTLGLTAASGDTVAFEITSRPDTSAVPLGFVTAEQLTVTEQASTTLTPGSLSVAALAGLGNVVTFDVPGEYAVSAYDLRQLVAIPSYPGDPSGESRVQLLGIQSATVHIGSLLDLPVITTRGDGATLRIQVNDTTVRAAEWVSPLTEKARVAILETAVLTPTAALVGSAVSTLGPDLQTITASIRAAYEAHRVLAAAHQPNTDTTNTTSRTDADSQEGAIQLLNELLEQITAHLRESSASAAPWHTDAGPPVTDEDDLKNLPLVRAAQTLSEATVLASDLGYRVYDRHRVQTAAPASHRAADAVNTITASTVLDDAIVAFLDELAKLDPAVVAGEPEGATDAAHRYGFNHA